MRTHHQLAERLAARRETAGLSYNRLAQLTYERLGAFAPTPETIRTYHDPKTIPEQINAVVVTALADIYECRVDDLSAAVAADVKSLSDLLKRSTGWLSQVAA